MSEQNGSFIFFLNWYLNFERRSDWFGGLFENDNASHCAQHIGSAAFVVSEDGIVVDVELQWTVMIRIEDFNVVVRLQRPVVFDPNEIGARFSYGRTGHVDSATDEAVSLFGVIFEPAGLICFVT